MVKQIRIRNLDIGYTTDYRDVKYPRLEFKTGNLLLVLPEDYQNEINLIEKHKGWIYKKSLMINLARKEGKEKQIKLGDKTDTKDFIIILVEKFSREIGTKVDKIYFRELKSKWGSCSPKRRLTFNTLLKYLPENLIKYVVFHEIVHLKERYHNGRFWSIISQKFKNYKKNEKELLIYWFLIKDIQ